MSGPSVADGRSSITATALDGIGLAHIHEILVADHTARDTLVHVLQDWCPVLPQCLLHYPGRRHMPAPSRAFVDMVRTSPTQ